MFSKSELSSEAIQTKIALLNAAAMKIIDKRVLANNLLSMAVLFSKSKPADRYTEINQYENICAILVPVLQSGYLCESLHSTAMTMLKNAAEHAVMVDILAKTPGIFALLAKKLNSESNMQEIKCSFSILRTLTLKEEIPVGSVCAQLLSGLLKLLNQPTMSEESKQHVLLLFSKLTKHPRNTQLLIQIPNICSILIELFTQDTTSNDNKVIVFSILVVLIQNAGTHNELISKSAAIFSELLIQLKNIHMQKEQMSFRANIAEVISALHFLDTEPTLYYSQDQSMVFMKDVVDPSEEAQCIYKRHAMKLSHMGYNAVVYIWHYLAQHPQKEAAVNEVGALLAFLLPHIKPAQTSLAVFEGRYKSLLTPMKEEHTVHNHQAINYSERIFKGLGFTSGVFESLMLIMRGTKNSPSMQLDIKLAAICSLELLCGNNPPLTQITPATAYDQRMNFKRSRLGLFAAVSASEEVEVCKKSKNMRQTMEPTDIEQMAFNRLRGKQNNTTRFDAVISKPLRPNEIKRFGAPFADDAVGSLSASQMGLTTGACAFYAAADKSIGTVAESELALEL